MREHRELDLFDWAAAEHSSIQVGDIIECPRQGIYGMGFRFFQVRAVAVVGFHGEPMYLSHAVPYGAFPDQFGWVHDFEAPRPTGVTHVVPSWENLEAWNASSYGNQSIYVRGLNIIPSSQDLQPCETCNGILSEWPWLPYPEEQELVAHLEAIGDWKPFHLCEEVQA